MYEDFKGDYLNDSSEVDRYVTQEALNLKSTADKEPWEPSDYIRSIIPSIDNIRIYMLDSSRLRSIEKTFEKLEDCINEDQNVGLVIMGKNIDRFHKPALIALITKSTLFIIDIMDKNHGIYIDYLREKLNDSSITFWTTQGLDEADSLLHNFNISLANSGRCYDCQAMNAFMMDLLKSQPKTVLSWYPHLAALTARRPTRIESWDKLIEIWLDIPIEDFNFEYCQIDHLHKRPLSLTAINCIKKRCLLVKPLASKLVDCIWFDAKFLSSSFHRRLSLIDDQDLYKYMLNQRINNQKRASSQQSESEGSFPSSDSPSSNNGNHRLDLDIISHYGLGSYVPSSGDT